MAIEVLRKKQTGSGASATLAITGATAGNLLVAFFSQGATTATPTAKDNVSGSTGWNVNATHAIGNTSASSLYVATKIAVGTETELNPTAGTGGTIQGISYYELVGCSETTDTILHTDNVASGKTATSPSTTTTDAGDILLVGVGGQGAANFGEILAWSGTGPELTNVETPATRCFSGYKVLTETISAKTFTANWTTSRNASVLLVALKPTAAAGVSNVMVV